RAYGKRPTHLAMWPPCPLAPIAINERSHRQNRLKPASLQGKRPHSVRRLPALASGRAPACLPVPREGECHHQSQSEAHSHLAKRPRTRLRLCGLEDEPVQTRAASATNGLSYQQSQSTATLPQEKSLCP